MAENEKVVETAVEDSVETVAVESPVTENKPSNGPSAQAGINEWFRKKIVALKRKPNVIPLFLFLISSMIYLLNLVSFSQTGLNVYSGGDLLGLPVFVNCLLSILICVVHLNAFPKRSKKVNLLNYILIYLFAAAMLGMDILYYIKVLSIVEKDSATLATAASVVQTSAIVSIVHIVFLAISVIALATLPLYTKLIMKINTSKAIEESQLDEVIESEDEEA